MKQPKNNEINVIGHKIVRKIKKQQVNDKAEGENA
jgi:hypothetical protein